MIAAPLLVAALALLPPVPPGAAPAASSALAGRLRGAVTSPDRKPIPGARVAARARLADREILFVAVCDDIGSYTMEDMPAGLYRVDVFAEGHVSRSTPDVDVKPPFRNILDFRLADDAGPAEPGAASPAAANAAGAPAPLDVAGAVRLPDHAPVPDAEVALTGGPPPGRWMSLSTADGSFTLPAVASGLYELTITASGMVPLRIPGLTLSAPGPLEIRATLVDFPADRAVRQEVILLEDKPLPPARWLPIP
jgi:carboxypeptidase family protein